ncbi:hypothetical protein JQC67_11605, partial [Aurantibacter crassamenti]|uniref:beta strand repeat-containing protein n=1 Tax=Aurantibacter crassamenti TaxID=1837375 RepID=UPI001939B36F
MKINYFLSLFLFLNISIALAQNGLNVVGGTVSVSGGATISVVNGNFQVSNEGQIKNDALISVGGDWLNNNTGAAFTADSEGTVSLNSTTSAIIGGTTSTIFYNLILDVDEVTLEVNTIVGGNISGTNLGVLDLKNTALNLNSNTLQITNDLISALITNEGFIVSEDVLNESKVIWQTSATGGLYTVPFGTAIGESIPLAIERASGDLGTITVSTYPVGLNMLPYPTVPEAVLNMVDSDANDISGNAVQRFWQLDKSGAGAANITMTYANSEEPVSGENGLSAFRYDTSVDNWELKGALTRDFANNTVTVSNVSEFSPWILAGGTPEDIDGDGIANADDLDNDNDGILDTDEGVCIPNQSGNWGGTVTNVTYDYGDGLIIRMTTAAIEGFALGSFNAGGAGFWSEDLAGDPSIQCDFQFGESVTISFEDSSGNPVQVTNPIIHFDRIGGSANNVQNSAEISLQDGLTWMTLAGTNDFSTTSTTARDAGAGVTDGNAANGYTAESSMNDASGTAAGSLQIQATISTFTLNFPAATTTTGTADGIEMIVFACNQIDDDNDGIPNFLDLDSDGDDCPDAMEGSGSYSYDDIDSNGSLTATPNSSGIPGGTSQGIGTSQNNSQQSAECTECHPSHPSYTNNDSDTVGNNCDLDDDNDGILDIDELNCAPFGLVWSDHYVVGGDTGSGDDPTINAASPPLVFDGVTITIDRTSNTTGNWKVNTGYVPSGYTWLQAAILDGESVHTFEFTENVYNLAFTLLDIDTGPNFTDQMYIEAFSDGAAYQMMPVDYVLAGTSISYDGNNTFTGGGTDEDLQINFSVPINKIVIHYRQDGSNPSANQGSGIADLSFCVPEDLDNDGIRNYLDIDSDNDGCNDAIEAGHLDADNDGEVDGSGYDANGRVTGAATAYTGTNAGVTTAAETSIDTAPTNQEERVGDNATFTVVASALEASTYSSGTPMYDINANGGLSYQWQVSTNAGSTFSDISGATNSSLTVSDVTLLMDGNIYKVLVSHDNNACPEEAQATLSVINNIDAINDSEIITAVEGFFGVTDVLNVLDNDEINGAILNPASVTITPVTNGPLTVNGDGSVDVASNTTPNIYTVDYQICEASNPTNCDIATVTITVGPNSLPTAQDDEFTAIEDSSNNDLDVLANNGNGADNFGLDGPNSGTITLPSVTTANGGTVSVNDNSTPNDPTDDSIIYTPALDFVGDDTFDYTITDANNDSSTATVTVTVSTLPLVAVADDFSGSPVNGFTGGDAGDVTINDTLNGVAVDDNDINITITDIDGLTGVTIATDGTITVPAGTTAGSYDVEYSICEKLNTSNCDTAIATIVVSAAPIVAVADDFSGSPVNGFTGGDAGDVTINDTLNGVAVDDNDINITITDIDGLTGVTIATDGTISVPAGTTAGSYDVEYSICEKLNTSNCDTAIATIVVSAAPIVAVADDFSGSPVNGFTGGDAGDVTINDTLNGVAVDDNDINITITDIDGLTGVTIATDGTITVPAGTTAGSYDVEYSICEKLNTSNCDTAIATIVVAAAPIVAVADDFSGSPVNGFTGGDAGDVTINDTLNGVAVDDNDINITITDIDGLTGVTIATDGTISVPAGTTAGSYDVEYSICEKLNTSNCDTAIATIVVSAAPIVAVADDFSGSPVNGFTGGDASDVTINDTLNGAQVDDNDINITITDIDGLTGVTIAPDGTITVPAGTTAGSYDVEYSICEKLNTSNCDTAIATIVVSAAPIVAVADDFSGSPVNGFTGGDAGDVTINDTLNGVAVDDNDINITITDIDGLTGVTIDTDGTITVPAGTTAGSYDVEYSICEKLNTSNCDTAIATIVVSAAPIVAVADDFSGSPVNGFTGGDAGDVTINDTLNGVAVDDNDINITITDIDGLTGVTIATDGTISVPAGTTAGSYDVEYSICEKLNTSNCDTAIATIVVSAAPIVAVADDFSASPVNGFTGGDAGDVTINDTLNGVAVDDNDINITITDIDGLTGVTIATDGTITVPAGTAANTYNVEYSICEKLNTSNCDTAIATIVVSAAPIVAVADDFSGSPVNGFTGGDAGDVTINDTLNGAQVDDNDINITITDIDGLTGVTIATDGTITVPAGTTAGSYDVEYSICEKLNTSNCDTAIATIVVSAAPIVAVADDFSGSPVNGFTGGDAGDVTINDTLNGVAVDDNDINITITDIDGLTGVTIATDGTITLPAGTTAGSYDVVYSICEKLNTSNCDTAIATIVVAAAPIVAVADDFSGSPVNGFTGGDAGDVTINDTLNGVAVDDNDINITITDIDGLTGVTIATDGTITLP